MKEYVQKKRWSLKSRLILAFLATSIIPVIAMNLFSYYNTSKIVTDHVKELNHANLQQKKSSLDVWMESYEDILFQIYTDDDIVAMIDNINKGEDISVNKNQLRRTLHGLFYTKDYIKCITVLTANGTMVSYDMLTGSNTNSWIDSIGFSRDELYDTVSSDNHTRVFSTQPGIVRGVDTYYLFHLGHRIIDYRDVNKDLGIVMVSMDEQLLDSVCSNEEDNKYQYSFIVDADGRMVSHPDKSLITDQIISWSDSGAERLEGYRNFVEVMEGLDGKAVSVDSVYDEKSNWDIISVSSQDEVMKRLDNQQKIMTTTLAVSLAALATVIILLIRSLTGAIQNVVMVMKAAGKGDLTARVSPKKNMPAEVEVISREFNGMLSRLSLAMEKEKEAVEKQRNAEITALEAQMNPHFLYNTLDTINWMAIDKEEYEISNSINALANILRYGIDNSNGIVTVRDEQEWLKKYLFLQQTRLKNTFSCEIHIAPELWGCRIHKLLLQPFVENSIIHGFEGVSRKHFLSVSMEHEEDSLKIVIYDNGKGISPEMTEQMNRGIFPESDNKNHIGMENAINRIKMYYGGQGSVSLESSQGEYTKVLIKIPFMTE